MPSPAPAGLSFWRGGSPEPPPARPAVPGWPAAAGRRAASSRAWGSWWLPASPCWAETIRLTERRTVSLRREPARPSASRGLRPGVCRPGCPRVVSSFQFVVHRVSFDGSKENSYNLLPLYNTSFSLVRQAYFCEKSCRFPNLLRFFPTTTPCARMCCSTHPTEGRLGNGYFLLRYFHFFN